MNYILLISACTLLFTTFYYRRRYKRILKDHFAQQALHVAQLAAIASMAQATIQAVAATKSVKQFNTKPEEVHEKRLLTEEEKQAIQKVYYQQKGGENER